MNGHLIRNHPPIRKAPSTITAFTRPCTDSPPGRQLGQLSKPAATSGLVSRAWSRPSCRW